ncbi:MAG: ABC transporter ATP-binding protein [Schwartzia sp.]|nr:ABC transporter ATP-binding protein [Schwartzia sp. (in: firmicutes)]
MIELKQVEKSFGDKKVLKGISLRVEDGETLALIGGSGSGKSTLLRLMIGLDRPTSGEIWVDDTEISRLSEEELDEVRLSMGMVFQYSALFDSMTVGDNVAFGLREHTDYTEDEIQKIVEEKLALVGLPDAAGMMPSELSGGMKKRVSLARAIAFEPSIIFYDEPDSGLDPVITQKIDDLIRQTQKALGVTSVVVTHDMESACLVADRIAMIYEGELIADEPVESFRRLKDPRVRAFLRGLALDDKENVGGNGK